ncbi:thioredoxin domain-containing protein 5-like [Neodiprion virginianus]|uniref:thioredoxin domain-containing protein 5-like n=1 Tax=Neodiprion virginianus TaxID=2961670 RepID=UPI001EE708E1|nr:thioredoxin domain-containing protein 5-like [Neodiprion virginianus]
MFLKLTLLLATFFICRTTLNAQITNVRAVDYSAEKFRTEVAKKDHFVMFYTSWCIYSLELMPTWDQLASTLNGSQIQIAKIDCDRYGRLCWQNSVTGYPTLKFFKAGQWPGVKYMGNRRLHDMRNYIDEQGELSSREYIFVGM